MTDNEIKALIDNSIQQAVATTYKVALEQGQQQGLVAGIIQGEKTGFVKGLRFCQAALSDGTRRGSSECGKALKFLDGLED